MGTQFPKPTHGQCPLIGPQSMLLILQESPHWHSGPPQACGPNWVRGRRCRIVKQALSQR
jgi:hypothetical protein